MIFIEKNLFPFIVVILLAVLIFTYNLFFIEKCHVTQTYINSDGRIMYVYCCIKAFDVKCHSINFTDEQAQ